jgi:site-specific recombinase XerD
VALHRAGKKTQQRREQQRQRRSEAMKASYRRRQEEYMQAQAKELERQRQERLREWAETNRRREESSRAYDDLLGIIDNFRKPAVPVTAFRLLGFNDPSRVSVAELTAAYRRLAKEHHPDRGGTGEEFRKLKDAYLADIKGFTRWLWRDKRMAVDPFAGLPRLASKGGEADVTHARRDFLPEELERLLSTARRSGEALRKLSGLDRYFLYLTACATGFRASELASLMPESFRQLDGPRPTATVCSSCTKNRREAVQPLPADVARALAGWLRDKPAGVPVWPGKWPSRAFLMIRVDLETARQQWLAEAPEGAERAEREASDFLAYVDHAGRYGDFHALRHSYITAIGRTGAAPKVHQELARHSSYALTGRYTHAHLHDLAGAVAELPPLVPSPGPGELAATGTDGKSLGPFLGPDSESGSDKVRRPETGEGSPKKGQNPGKHGTFAVFQGGEQEAPKPADSGTRSPGVNAGPGTAARKAPSNGAPEAVQSC